MQPTREAHTEEGQLPIDTRFTAINLLKWKRVGETAGIRLRSLKEEGTATRRAHIPASSAEEADTTSEGGIKRTSIAGNQARGEGTIDNNAGEREAGTTTKDTTPREDTNRGETPATTRTEVRDRTPGTTEETHLEGGSSRGLNSTKALQKTTSRTTRFGRREASEAQDVAVLKHMATEEARTGEWRSPAKTTMAMVTPMTRRLREWNGTVEA
jgi:hypothetical protein